MGTSLVVQRPSDAAAKAARLERAQALKEMPQALRDEVAEIESILQDETGLVLKNRWVIGSKIDVIQKDTKYGSSPLRLLSTYFGIHKDILNGCHLFYQRYNKDQLEVLLNARTKGGTAISWSHANVLARVADAKIRKQLLDAVVKEDLSVRALEDRVEAYLGGKPLSLPAAAGSTVPKKFRGFIRQILSTTDQIKTRRSIWEDPDHGLLAAYDNTPPDELTEDDLPLVQDALTELSGTKDGLELICTELEKIRGKIERRLVTAKQAVTAGVKDKSEEEEEEEPEE